jgi:hypothetical protein
VRGGRSVTLQAVAKGDCPFERQAKDIDPASDLLEGEDTPEEYPIWGEMMSEATKLDRDGRPIDGL